MTLSEFLSEKDRQILEIKEKVFSLQRDIKMFTIEMNTLTSVAQFHDSIGNQEKVNFISDKISSLTKTIKDLKNEIIELNKSIDLK